MGTPTVPHAPTRAKPEPPPILVMLRTLEESCAERDRRAAERLVTLLRSCGRR
jgi:hypothetical protein